MSQKNDAWEFRIIEYFNIYGTVDSREMCVFQDETLICQAGNEKIAKFIAAAPDMFEALEYILDVVGPDAAYDLTLGEKAIKKAKGEL